MARSAWPRHWSPWRSETLADSAKTQGRSRIAPPLPMQFSGSVAERLRADERGRERAAERPLVAQATPVATILNLQQTAGNRATGRFLARRTATGPKQTGLRDDGVLHRFTKKAADFIARNGDGSLQQLAIYLGAAINVELGELGIPDVHVVTSKVDIPASGQFFAEDWTVVLNPKHFSNRGATTMGELTAAEAALIADTVAHEARHAEQHFRMARLDAAEGKDPAAGGLDADAAKAAADMPLDLRDSRSAKAVKEARAWRSSRYGEDAIYREVVTSWMEDLRVWAHRLHDATDQDAEDLRRRFGGLLAAWAKPGHAIEVLRAHLPGAKTRKATRVIEDLTRIITQYATVEATFAKVPQDGGAAGLEPLTEAAKELFRSVDTAYRNLPIEADAYETGDAAFAAFPGATP